MKEDEFLARIQELGGLSTRKEADRWALRVLVDDTEREAEDNVSPTHRIEGQTVHQVGPATRRRPARDRTA